MSFARGLNDTPKIVALLLLIKGLSIQWGIMAVAIGMAVGGLLNRSCYETSKHTDGIRNTFIMVHNFPHSSRI